MSGLDWIIYSVGVMTIFMVAGATTLWLLAWLSDEWDALNLWVDDDWDRRPRRRAEDEHASDLPPPWLRRKK